MTKRRSGIDLIKILMMIWIVMFHMANHSMVDLLQAPISVSWIFEAFCKIGGGVSDCVFVLLTGLLYYNKMVKLSRIIQLWCQVWFYSVVIGCLCMITGMASLLSLGDIVKMIFPVIYNQYPYFSAYIILFLLIPFLNRLIEQMKIEQLRKFSLFLMMVVSIIPTFTVSSWIMSSTQLPMFIALYVFGAGMGRFGKDFIPLGKHPKIVAIILILLVWISEIVLHILGLGVGPFYFVWDMNKLPVVIIAIELVEIFRNVRIHNSHVKRLLELGSKSVFGVYLIHIHRTLKTPLLDGLFDNSTTYGTWLLIPQVILGSVAIFIICVFLDWIRINTLERLVSHPILYLSRTLYEKLNLEYYCKRE